VEPVEMEEPPLTLVQAAVVEAEVEPVVTSLLLTLEKPDQLYLLLYLQVVVTAVTEETQLLVQVEQVDQADNPDILIL
jgi:hypothetical protein